MPGNTHGIEPTCSEIDGHLADRLHGIGVHRDAVGVRDRDDVGDGLHGADLVVGPHHGHEGHRRRIGLDGRTHGLGPHPPQHIDVQPNWLCTLVASQPFDTVEHRMMLDGTREDANPARIGRTPGPEESFDGEVVGLGAAGGEDDLARAGAERLGNCFARLFDDPASRPTSSVQRRRVAHQPS